MCSATANGNDINSTVGVYTLTLIYAYHIATELNTTNITSLHYNDTFGYWMTCGLTNLQSVMHLNKKFIKQFMD